MKKITFLAFCSALLCLLLSSCADLKGINKFAINSSTIILQPFPYSYHDYFFDSCYIYDSSTALTHTCDSTVAVAYDSAVAREAAKLSNYFKALAQLSGSSEYVNVDTVSGVVPAGTYGSLRISDTEAAVVSGLATAIQDLLNANFKSKHLTANLRNYGGTVDSALAAYDLHLQALDGQCVNLLSYLTPRRTVYRAETAAKPGSERLAVMAFYNQKIRELQIQRVRFKALLAQVQLIRDGYHQLIVNADDIKSKTLKQKLLAFVNNISYLSSTKH